MRSVRFRLAATAALVTAIAVTVVAVLLVVQIRSSLTSEIDDGLVGEVLDYDAFVTSLDDIAAARVPLDIDRLFLVTSVSGEVVDANDLGVDGVEVVAALGLGEPGAVLNELVPLDISLKSPSETQGVDSLRAVYTELLDIDYGEPLYVVSAQATESRDRTVRRTQNALLAGIPPLVALVAVLAWWLTGRSLRPVEKMTSEVDEIRSTDLSRRVSEPPADDEIGRLANTMNQMLTRLEDAQKSQERFVSDAAHELRTPLASIAAQLDVDALHPGSADPAKTAANTRAEISRLQSLVDSLLASARSQNGHQLARTLVDVDDLVAEAVMRLVAPPGVLVSQDHVSAGAVRGDRAMLASMIDNLLSNAYRHARSRVVCGVGVDAVGVWLTVEDDGSGIAGSDRERVFDRFVRLDESRSKDAGGSGLGLALVREAAERHGGTVVAEPSALGGARFVVRLPAAV